jgi:L,D-transpeptidase-like protein
MQQEPVEFVMRRHAVILAAALAWLISIESAEARLDILVDKATQRMLVMQNGYMRYMWPISTGRDETATPNGVYTPQRLERNWFSTAYYNSPMPYSIFFHNGYAIHGSYAIDRLGGPASHGCVRLHPHHAAVLFDLVQQEGPDRTIIEVSDEGRRPEEASLPVREIAAGPGVNPQMPRTARYPGDLPDLSTAQRGSRLMGARNPSPLMPVPMMDGGRAGEPQLPLREIAEGPGGSPPVPRRVNYREAGDMPALPLSQRGDRLIAARNSLPPRPPASRYLPADVRPPLTDGKPPASVLRAPSGAREVDTANRAQRASNEPYDSRSKPRVAEASLPERTQQAASVLTQQSASASNFRLLPASCWSGGASRWRWWASSEGTPCK